MNEKETHKAKFEQRLRSSQFKAETERHLSAPQEQNLSTRNYRKDVMKRNITGNWIICEDRQQAITYIVSGCPVLAKKKCVHRYDKVGTYTQWDLCQCYEMTK